MTAPDRNYRLESQLFIDFLLFVSVIYNLFSEERFFFI